MMPVLVELYHISSSILSHFNRCAIFYYPDSLSYFPLPSLIEFDINFIRIGTKMTVMMTLQVMMT